MNCSGEDKEHAPGVSEMMMAVTALECDNTARLMRCAVACASQSLDAYLQWLRQHAALEQGTGGTLLLAYPTTSWRGVDGSSHDAREAAAAARVFAANVL